MYFVIVSRSHCMLACLKMFESLEENGNMLGSHIKPCHFVVFT